MNKHVVLALLLCLATAQARLFHDDALATAGRSLLQENACPAGCAANSCMPDSTGGGSRCIQCDTGINLDLESGTCVCPPGKYATGGTCADCTKGSFCLGGTFPAAAEITCDSFADSSSAAGGLTTRGKRATTSSACVNSPGHSFSRVGDKPKATVCAVNTYGPGLRKQAACLPCPSGFITLLDTRTSASACVVPKGYYLKSPGEVAPCPKGEYQATNANVGQCTACAAGVTTAAEASDAASACKVLLPTFYPLTVTGTGADLTITATKKCPQKYFCPGGEATEAFTPGSPNPGTSTRVTGCPDGLWTESFGASSADQCLTPPGHFTTGGATTACNIAQGQYRADWKRAADASACDVCGTNILSEEVDSITVYAIADETQTSQTAVAASTGACYILPGQGMYYSPTSKVFSAVNCDTNNYGVSQKTNGLGGFACRQCPVNMVASAVLSNGAHVAANGLTSPLACVNIDGFGYNGRIATQCPIDSYNAAGNRLTCTKCPAGRRTDGEAANQVTSADCKIAPGFGKYGTAVVPCPVGTYNNDIMATDAECTACDTGFTTSQPGGLAEADCNLCVAGWGGAAGACGAAKCGGTGATASYGPTGREATGVNSECLTCPTMTLGFTFNYNGDNNAFTPVPVSREGAESTADCLSSFAQLAPDAWYLGGAQGTLDATADTFDDCVAACTDTCVFVEFNYAAVAGSRCYKMAYTATVGTTYTAMKAVQAGDVTASSKAANSTVQAKGLSSGSYTFWKADGTTWGATTAGPTTVGLQACLTSCDIVDNCAGVVMTGITSASTEASSVGCTRILGNTTPAQFKRGATHAVRTRLDFLAVVTDAADA